MSSATPSSTASPIRAMIGGQTKTPTISVLFEHRARLHRRRRRLSPKHLRAAGADVAFSTVLGEDALKDFVLDGLRQAGVECRPIIDKTRPTTNKNAIIVGRLSPAQGRYARQPLDFRRDRARACQGDRHRARPTRWCSAISATGMFNRRTIPDADRCDPEAACIKVADSQVASRWGNITEFESFDLITPNEREARFALGDQDSGDSAAGGAALRRRAMQDPDPQARRHAACSPAATAIIRRSIRFLSSTAFVDRWSTRVGAGDALLAYATLCDAGRAMRASSRRLSAPWPRPANARRTAMSRSISSDVAPQARRRRARSQVQLDRHHASHCRRARRSGPQAPAVCRRRFRRAPSIRQSGGANSAIERRAARYATMPRSLCVPDAAKIELLDYLRRSRQARARRKAAWWRKTK